MAVVAAWRTGPAALLAAGPRWFGGRGERRLVGRVGGGGFRLAAKELAFAQAELGAHLFQFSLEFGEAGASALMHTLPVASLLAEFEVFSKQRAEVAARKGGRECGRACRGRGREYLRVRCKIHTTSMNSTQLQREVSRRTRLPNLYGTLAAILSPLTTCACSPGPSYSRLFPVAEAADRDKSGTSSEG